MKTGILFFLIFSASFYYSFWHLKNVNTHEPILDMVFNDLRFSYHTEIKPDSIKIFRLSGFMENRPVCRNIQYKDKTRSAATRIPYTNDFTVTESDGLFTLKTGNETFYISRRYTVRK